MRGFVRILTGLAVAWFASVGPALAQSDSFPSRPVTLIVPFQAGISVDILLRGVDESAAAHLGQPVIVDHKPGGSATLGPAMMASTPSPTATPLRNWPCRSFDCLTCNRSASIR